MQAIGNVLPIAVAMAISSVPITATILILLSPHRPRLAVPFLIGYVLGLAGVVCLCTAASELLPTTRSARRPDTTIGILEILIGLALAASAIVSARRARRAPNSGLPTWLSTIGTLPPWGSFGLALVFNVRPKALLLAMASGLTIRADSTSVSQSLVAIAVYTVIAASTVAVPIIATLAAPARMEPRLVRADGWLSRNSTTVTELVLIMVAVVVIGTGITRRAGSGRSARACKLRLVVFSGKTLDWIAQYPASSAAVTNASSRSRPIPCLRAAGST